MGAVVLALVLCQLLLPHVAVDRIRSRLGRYGQVQSVSVSAWPAVKLLWRQADTVRVRAGSLSLSIAQAAQLIHEARGLHEVTLSASRLTLSSLMLSGLRLHKRGSLLQASGVSSQADAKALLPPGLGLRLLSSTDGQIRARVVGRLTNAGLFGPRGPVEVLVGPLRGRLVVRPLPLSRAGPQIVLFSSPELSVVAVSASALGGSGASTSFRLAMTVRAR